MNKNSLAAHYCIANMICLSSNGCPSSCEEPECNYNNRNNSNEGTLVSWINHYLTHNYKLLHIGTETDGDYQGNKLSYSTVAYLGK